MSPSIRSQLAHLAWRVLSPTIETIREEGREEVREAVRDVHPKHKMQRMVPRSMREEPEDHEPFYPCLGCGEAWPCETIRALDPKETT